MKADVKAKWVEALRSNEYGQGQEVLRDGDAYCCLGVLCDLAALEGVGAWEEDGSFVCPDGDIGLALPPLEVISWADLPGFNPTVTRDGKGWALSGLNDNGTSFGEIADLIEAQL